ncbi:MAG: HemK/PrmC family methyltransferase [Patescibacteria group bacterium]
MAMTREQTWLLQEKYGGEKSSDFYADCKRLALGEPLGYVIGWVPFLNTRIHLDSHPLIPRPETEHWIAEAIESLLRHTTPTLGLNDTEPLHILDLCAGSGCIGVAVLHSIPQAHVTFAELDASHLPTIEANCRAQSIDPARYTIVQSDCFRKLPEIRFDTILSNPPYIDAKLDRVESSVEQYEPALALYGGARGLQLIERIITESPEYLRTGGTLWLEHEPEQVPAISELARHQGFHITTYPDQYQIPRYSVLLLQ